MGMWGVKELSDGLSALVQKEQAESLILHWVASLLESPGVSSGDNFLDLGGHSMLAVDLDRQVLAHFGVTLDMRLLFEETIGETVSDIVRQLGTG